MLLKGFSDFKYLSWKGIFLMETYALNNCESNRSNILLETYYMYIYLVANYISKDKFLPNGRTTCHSGLT